jgi:hypothetical protein
MEEKMVTGIWRGQRKKRGPMGKEGYYIGGK